MKDIKFTIIIPAYNSENYIKDCLESIINQTYKNLEIIVIDDCSTDNTLKILKEYKNIKLLSTPINSKQGAARNVGIENCTGDYILFVDSDDTLYDNTVIEKIVNKVESEPDIIYLGIKMVGKRDSELIPNKENTNKAFRLGKNPFINVISICWKASLIKENNIRFPENIRYEDVYFAFWGIEKAKTYKYIDSFYYTYYNRESSTTTTYSIEQAKDTIKLIEKLYELYNYIDDENKIYLEERILQQAERAKVRLDRGIKEMLKKEQIN